MAPSPQNEQDHIKLSQRIRDLYAQEPHLTGKQISERLGVSHSLFWQTLTSIQQKMRETYSPFWNTTHIHNEFRLRASTPPSGDTRTAYLSYQTTMTQDY